MAPWGVGIKRGGYLLAIILGWVGTRTGVEVTTGVWVVEEESEVMVGC